MDIRILHVRMRRLEMEIPIHVPAAVTRFGTVHSFDNNGLASNPAKISHHADRTASIRSPARIATRAYPWTLAF